MDHSSVVAWHVGDACLLLFPRSPPRDRHNTTTWNHSPSSFPVLEAVPGRPELLSNSKLVLLSVPTSGLIPIDMSAEALSGPFRVRVGSWVSSAIVRPQEQARKGRRHGRADVAFDACRAERMYAAQGSTKCGLPVELAFQPPEFASSVECYRDCTRGRPRLPTLIFAGIIVPSACGDDGGHWYSIHVLLRYTTLNQTSPLALVSSSHLVAHVECCFSARPASSLHLRVRARLRTNTRSRLVRIPYRWA